MHSQTISQTCYIDYTPSTETLMEQRRERRLQNLAYFNAILKHPAVPRIQFRPTWRSNKKDPIETVYGGLLTESKFTQLCYSVDEDNERTLLIVPAHNGAPLVIYEALSLVRDGLQILGCDYIDDEGNPVGEPTMDHQGEASKILMCLDAALNGDFNGDFPV